LTNEPLASNKPAPPISLRCHQKFAGARCAPVLAEV
jgi:hypothetical protein